MAAHCGGASSERSGTASGMIFWNALSRYADIPTAAGKAGARNSTPATTLSSKGLALPATQCLSSMTSALWTNDMSMIIIIAAAAGGAILIGLVITIVCVKKWQQAQCAKQQPATATFNRNEESKVDTVPAAQEAI